MYDSLLSDSNKRDVGKGKISLVYAAAHDSMDSPFCNLEDFREFMYSYYTEGQSIIAHMRDRVPRDLPDVALLLEKFFKRYIMLKLELDCYFSTVVNYDADKMDKAELRFWPNHILKNMDENISWIMEHIRGRANLGEFYHDSLEQLKLLLYQMRAATVMYDWRNF